VQEHQAPRFTPGSRDLAQAISKKAVLFFKKNQKTFVLKNRGTHQRPSESDTIGEKFFGSFFQKRTACLFHDHCSHRFHTAAKEAAGLALRLTQV
jgi:hypothetical protein